MGKQAYILALNVVTNKFSLGIPGAVLKRLSNDAALFTYTPVLTAILRKVIQKLLAS